MWMVAVVEDERVEPQTLSHALLKLGKIRSIEDPIMFGLLGFYRAKNYSNLSMEEADEMKQHLGLFLEFCLHFKSIADLSLSESKNSLDQWLSGRNRTEKTSRIGTYAGVQMVFSSEDIKNKAGDFKCICKTTREVLEGKIHKREVNRALKTLEDIQQLVGEKLEPQRRSSEKIISNNIPPMHYGATQ